MRLRGIGRNHSPRRTTGHPGRQGAPSLQRRAVRVRSPMSSGANDPRVLRDTWRIGKLTCSEHGAVPARWCAEPPSTAAWGCLMYRRSHDPPTSISDSACSSSCWLCTSRSRFDLHRSGFSYIFQGLGMFDRCSSDFDKSWPSLTEFVWSTTDLSRVRPTSLKVVSTGEWGVASAKLCAESGGNCNCGAYEAVASKEGATAHKFRNTTAPASAILALLCALQPLRAVFLDICASGWQAERGGGAQTAGRFKLSGGARRKSSRESRRTRTCATPRARGVTSKTRASAKVKLWPGPPCSPGNGRNRPMTTHPDVVRVRARRSREPTIPKENSQMRGVSLHKTGIHSALVSRHPKLRPEQQSKHVGVPLGV